MRDPRRVPSWRRQARIAILFGFAAASVMPVASAQDLGRLFLTPQQRKNLDRQRQADFVAKETVVESLVTVNGRVTRSTGRTTTWINGVPEDDTYRSADPARVAVDGGSSRVPVKVGQTLDRSRGEVKDALQGGQIQVPGSPPGR